MKTSTPRVLIADDQADVLEALRLLLKGEGYKIEAVNSPAGVIGAVEANEFDVVLMDLNYTRDTTSGEEGLDLIGRIQRIDSTLPIVVMTAWGSIELAVEAMRRGARDFEPPEQVYIKGNTAPSTVPASAQPESPTRA